MKEKSEISNKKENKIAVVLSPLKNNSESSLTLFKKIEETKEMKELKKMAEFDSKYLENKGYEVIYSFIGPEDYTEKLAQIFNKIEQSKPDEILICFTAHGSPGKNGQIGLDSSDGLGIDDLIDCLKNAKLNQLSELNLNFEFRSCNSAYTPIPMLSKDHFYAKKFKNGIPEEDEELIKKDLLNNTFIGEFQKKLSKELEIKASVSGFRGYYCPQIKTPKVSEKYNSKEQFLAEDFRVIISSNKKVYANLKNLIKMDNISEFKELFEEEKSSFSPKN